MVEQASGGNLRLPPHNIQAEQTVLGGILFDNVVLDQVSEFLQDNDFYRGAHKHIYSAMLELAKRREAIDLITLQEILKARGKIEQCGGAEYLIQLQTDIGSAAHVAHHARIVQRLSVLRRLINAATEIAEESYANPEDVQEFLDRAETRIFEISQQSEGQTTEPINEIMHDVVGYLTKLAETKSKITGLATGFMDLDHMTSGLQPGNLVLLAARPSMGKTSLALNMARNVVKNGQRAAFFSLEMSKRELALRLVASEARLELGEIRNPAFLREGLSTVVAAVGKLADYQLFVDDSSDVNVLQLRSKIRRLIAEHGDLDLVIIDYLQLMKGTSDSDARWQIVGDISRSLKGLAKELSLPIVALSQLKRRSEDRDDPNPKLSDLRESGSLEQDADIVIFVNRPNRIKAHDMTQPLDRTMSEVAELIVGKNRNGPIGKSEVLFFPALTTFDNPALPDRDDAPPPDWN